MNSLRSLRQTDATGKPSSSMNEANTVKLTVCGSFGFGNAGDEAVPLALADIGRHLGFSMNVNVVGRFDEPALSQVIGIGPRDVSRRESLRGHPLLLSGGGIIENNMHATIFRCENLYDKSFTPHACLFGISVEPGVTYGWRCKWRLWRALRSFEKVYVRDELSEVTLKKIFSNISTETIGDVVLWLRPDASELPNGLKLPEKYVAAVLAPRWGEDQEWREWISSELHTLCRELGAALVLVPMTGPFDDDRGEHKAIASKLALLKPELEACEIQTTLTPRAVAYVLGNATLVVSMRLHGCVMAYAQQTPCVGLTYHPKLSGFFRTVRWPAAQLPSNIPETQRREIYGYNFTDLALCSGDLLRAGTHCLSRRNYSRLPYLKERSAGALKVFLKATQN